VIIAGDGVDTNTPADFTFYEGLIDEFLPGIPVHWVPGNHESGASSAGTLDNFRQVTGRPAREAFDHEDVRYITLDSNLGSFRLSDFAQLAELKAELDDAAHERRLDGVVVVDHHAPFDVSGGGASQLSDALEANLLREWLAEFRERSGKQAALFSGHAHTAAVNRTDGVLEVNTPTVGKQPYGTADRGGFFGWMLVGADRRAHDPLTWLRAEVRPLIDGIELDAPAELAVGEAADVSATGVTSEYGLRFPLRYPASVRYTGESGLAVVRGERAAEQAARFWKTQAVLDLATMRLTAVRPGTVELTLASGDQEVATELVVTGEARPGWPRRVSRAGAQVDAVAAADTVAQDTLDLVCALDVR
jgi:hypothetical protein